MVTGGSGNRVGIGWPGSGERKWAAARGWYHVDCVGLIPGLDGAGKMSCAVAGKGSVFAVCLVNRLVLGCLALLK